MADWMHDPRRMLDVSEKTGNTKKKLSRIAAAIFEFLGSQSPGSILSVVWQVGNLT